jgi:hypothetical protein
VVVLINKNNDSAQHEVYGSNSNASPIYLRDVATTLRSTSSIRFQTLRGEQIRKTFTLVAASGVPVRLIGYLRKNASYGSATRPSITISGLGITPVAFTMPDTTDTWEKFDLTATQNSGNDGLLTITITAQSANAAGQAWFSGVPDAPFVTRCRHYGFMFDEASPTRTPNGAVSASEATAAGYTGATITWNAGATPSTTALTASMVFQYLYDLTQYQSCLNVGSNAPITGAGVAGAPSLFAQGNVTSTGFTLDGGGSLAMGAFTLTANQPWPYTFTGGTFSQSAGVPSFAGGRLNIGAAGGYTFGMSGGIVSMTPTAPGTYAFGTGTFSGTIDLRNTSAHAITVQVPAGTTTTTANNTGGAITVSAPTVNQSVTLNGVVAGSRVQIYDTTNNVELFNGTSGYSWTDPVPAIAPRNIRVRIAYQSGTSAKNFIEAAIGTCGITAPSNAVAYLASQTDDAVYNANGLDGSAVTGITISDGIDRMVINIAGGTVSWPQIYAYNVYWLTTSAGIVDDGSIIVARDTANYIVTLFKIRNSSTTPLSITGGYGVDSGTGTVPPLIDTAGSSGNIYQTPDHVIPYQTTGSYAITGDISTVLAAIPSATANADAVWAKTLP